MPFLRAVPAASQRKHGLVSSRLATWVGVLALACGTNGGGERGSGTGDGGAVSGVAASLPGVASISFPTGALPEGTVVSIEKRTDAATFGAFDDTAALFEPTGRSPYWVRVTIGTARPTGPATAALDLPAGFAAGPRNRFVVFGQLPPGSDQEYYDAFVALPSTYDAASGKVTATVAKDSFTANRTGNGTLEAILLLATAPSASVPGASSALAAAAGDPT